MTSRSKFDRLSTATKLLIALAIILLPIGGALAWGALRNLQVAELALNDALGQRTRLSVRAIESLIARNALALRVAANAAIPASGGDPCAQATRALGVAPAVARQFEIETATGAPLCSVGDFSDIVQPPRTAPGEIKLWIAEDESSLLLRTGVEGGSATSRLTIDELRASLRSEGGKFTGASLDDGRKRITLIPSPGGAVDPSAYRHRATIGGGRLEALIIAPVEQITTFEQILILLPLLMWLIAALVSWWLVNRYLVRPLRLLQRSVNSYEPGTDQEFVTANELGPATEIRDLRDAFVRAVVRIEETERGMAEALEGQRRLVREVHHRVKNNLQVVASLLSIHGRSADSLEGKAAFSAIGRRVDALSVVHRNHYAELEDNQGIALRALLTELAAGLNASAAEGDRKVVITLDVDRASTTQDVAVAVAFLVTEIVEFAMLRGEKAPIDITLRRDSPLTGRLTIASPSLLDSETDTPTRKQFERIVEGLARQLRSPLDRNLGRYSVDLPLFPERG